MCNLQKELQTLQALLATQPSDSDNIMIRMQVIMIKGRINELKELLA